MNSKDDLHQLICSLTKSEKRYFNLFAKQHIIGKENKYLRLFISISNQKEYDEIALKSILKDEKSIKNMAAEKYYLKELILKSLKHFHEKNFNDAILYDRLIQIEILYEKGLFEIGYDLLIKSMVVAEKYEKFLIYSLLMIWKINYDIKLNQSKNIFENIDIAISKAGLFQETMFYMKKTFEVLSEQRSINNQTHLKTLNQLKKEIDNYSNGKHNSVLGSYYYNTVLGLIEGFNDNKEKSEVLFKEAKDVFKNNPLFILEKSNVYLIANNNYIISLIDNNKLNDALIELDELEHFSTTLKLTNQLKARSFLIVADFRLLILQKQNDWGKSIQLTKDIEKGLIVHEKYIDPDRRVDLFISLSVVHFYAKNYKQSNKYLNKIIKTSVDDNTDITLIVLAKCIQLLILIYNNDFILLDNKILSIKRYVIRNNIDNGILLFLNFIQLKYSTNPNKLKIEKLKQDFINECESSATLKKLNNYFNLLEFL
jgi:hypothetical protein